MVRLNIGVALAVAVGVDNSVSPTRRWRRCVCQRVASVSERGPATRGPLVCTGSRAQRGLRTYGQGLALEPSNVQARNNYEKLAIKMALEQGKPVVRTLGQSQAEIDPHSATSYYQLGLRYLRNDEARAAVVALQQAIALQPNSDVAHLFLGLAYTSLGAYARAGANYRRAIALGPTNPHAYNYLGLTYHQQQRYREALAAYRQALQHDTNLQAV